jgi:hypothetical protein
MKSCSIGLPRLGAAAFAALAVFNAAASAAEPDLATGKWRMVEIGGQHPRAPATVNFTRVRWLGINTSCGPLWGWYRRSGTTLRIHIPGKGRHEGSSGSPCQGVDYRLLLGRVRSFRQETDGFALLGQDGMPIARLVPKQ